MNKRGFFTVDAVVALSIIATFIVITASFSLFTIRANHTHRVHLESAQIIWNHMEELSFANWDAINGQTRIFNNNLRCIYEVRNTAYRTRQLQVRFFIWEREYIFLLERGL